MRRIFVYYVMLTLLLVQTLGRVLSQNQPKHPANVEPRFKFGVSYGLGGVFMFGKPALDIVYGKNMLRVAPGVFYWSVGYMRHLRFYYREMLPRVLTDRPVVAGLSLSRSWLLYDAGYGDWFNLARQTMIATLLGIRAPMNYRWSGYVEFSAGPAFFYNVSPSKHPALIEPATWKILPMIQVSASYLNQNTPNKYRRFR